MRDRTPERPNPGANPAVLRLMASVYMAQGAHSAPMPGSAPVRPCEASGAVLAPETAGTR